MLELKSVKKSFGGLKAVNNCSFEVPQNKITALIGPNGSGKSTVFNLISGIYSIDSGKIILSNKELNGKAIHDISNLGVSRLFQQSRVFNNMTVRENILLALDTQDGKFWKNLIDLKQTSEDKENKVKEILELVGVEKMIDTRGDELSFGQKRLVEIARAIANPHTLLMLDEPLAGVNPKIRKDIHELLVKLRKMGETILLIEHDMNFTLKVADKIIVLDEGKKIAQGTPKQIQKNKLVLEAYLGE